MTGFSRKCKLLVLSFCFTSLLLLPAFVINNLSVEVSASAERADMLYPDRLDQALDSFSDEVPENEGQEDKEPGKKERKEEKEALDAESDNSPELNAADNSSAKEAAEPGAPAAEPAPSAAEVTPAEEEQQESYSQGTARHFQFRTGLTVTNEGSSEAQRVQVKIPLLENDSPYQDTALEGTSPAAPSLSGGFAVFDLGTIHPGEEVTVSMDYRLTVRPVAVSHSSQTLQKAKEAYREFAGSGNCYELSRGFVSRVREMGVEARIVYGYARPQRGGPMTVGSLQGSRHSWAEVYVEELGWVPVDLTFQYFGEFPHASHVIENYSNASCSVTYSGGKLAASWHNSIVPN